MLSLEKVLLAATASFLASAILADIFADLLLLILDLTKVSFDIYRVQVCLTFLCSVMGTCTYIITRKIHGLSLDFSRWEDKNKMPF